MPRSKTFTEWVSAPTEMKSTPVCGDLAGPLEGQPAGGLEGGPAGRDPHRLGHRSAVSMLSSRIRSQPASSSARSWSRSVTSTSTCEAGVRRADRLEGRHDAARGDHVVVLDHRHVGEAEPVVDPAAAAHGVLLQRPPAGQRLAGVEHARRRALQRVDPGGGRGGDAGEVGGEVERGALGGQQAAGRSGDPHHHVAGGDPGAVGEPVGDLDARRPSRPRRPARRSRDRRPRRARGPRTPREPRADSAMVAALVTSTLSPGRSSSSAPAIAARTASGSRPAADELVAGRRSCGAAVATAAPGGTPTEVLPSASTVSKWPDHCASSRSGKSSRQCEPRVSSRSRRRVGQRQADGEQVGGLPGVLVDRRVGVADERLQLVQRRSASPVGRAQHADLARSSRPGGRGVRRR